MKYIAAIVALAVFSAAAQETTPQPPAVASAAPQDSWLPSLPSREDLQKLPPQELSASRSAIKRVMLHYLIRLKSERHRRTLQNAAECAALAEQLHAPECFVRMLKIEAEAPLAGRDLYDYQLAFDHLLDAYGVDALSLRLFVEGMHYPAEAMRQVADTVPMADVFNLLTPEQFAESSLEACMPVLAELYAQLLDIYKGIDSREKAAAATDRLMQQLPAYGATAALRYQIARAPEQSRLGVLYSSLALDAGIALAAQRKRVAEAGFYGSSLLAALDYLLN